jgi:hypothetical protein
MFSMPTVSDIRSRTFVIVVFGWLAFAAAAPAAVSANAPVPAGITSPLPGATVNGSATFSWTSGTEVLAIWLDVGTTPGGSEIYAGAQTTLSRFITGLPPGGRTVYVRLW